MPDTFTGIQNEKEFYSHHQLAEVSSRDIQGTTARWREAVAEAETEHHRRIKLCAPSHGHTCGSDKILAASGGTMPACAANALGSANCSKPLVLTSSRPTTS